MGDSKDSEKFDLVVKGLKNYFRNKFFGSKLRANV